MKSLTGKVAFITGGTRGMGKAIARKLASEGAIVVFTHSGKNDEKASKVVEEIISNGGTAQALVAPNEDPAAMQKALQKTLDNYFRVDIIVNNAGIYYQKSIEDYTLEEFNYIIDVNVKAVFIAAQFAAKHMGSGGRFITIGSNMAERVTFPGGSLYAMSKSALTGLTKGLARDLGSKNIAVNLIQPGPIDTDMNPATSDHAPMIINALAIKRYGTANEIAGLVAYLAGQDAGFMTGASITMDGGFNI